jgi:molecular chaperone DnaJ
MKKDYYELLNVPRSATESDIKKSFRKLAQVYHPDKNLGKKDSEETFKEINEAYEVLMDPDKRSAYDRFGHAGVGASNQSNNPFGGMGFDPFGGMGFDPFAQFFRSGRAARSNNRTGPTQGEDLQCTLSITLEEVYNGTEKEIHYTKHSKCPKCTGTGSANGNSPQTCTTCQGRGSVNIIHGPFHVSQTCPACGGGGVIIITPCEHCNGEGRVEGAHIVRIKIPIGVETATQLRMPGGGSIGRRGGPPGDLYCNIAVLQHAFYTRENLNLKCNVNVPFVTATLGGEIDISGINEVYNLIIPPGTHSETVLSIPGKGIKSPNMQGDILARVRVTVPENLTNEQKQALLAFASL